MDHLSTYLGRYVLPLEVGIVPGEHVALQRLDQSTHRMSVAATVGSQADTR
jgi:hypothetical protein